jgi:hypothetical protein
MLHAFQEVQRIKKEHPDDACAVVNDRVKGSLKVTRAFGAGFLKQVWSPTHHLNIQALSFSFILFELRSPIPSPFFGA